MKYNNVSVKANFKNGNIARDKSTVRNMPMILQVFRRVELWVLLAILFLSSVYLYVFPAANLTYVAIVLLHAAVGVVAAAFLVPKLLAVVRAKSSYSDLGWLVLAAAAILGEIGRAHV